MKKVHIVFGLMVLIVLASLVFAISGATLSSLTQRGRWAGDSASSATTQGGNITGVNVTVSQLTTRWASFYGNLTGTIKLTDSVGTQNVYSWTWTNTNGGKVCASTNSAVTWASSNTTNGSDIDSAYAFGSASDNATNTLTSLCNFTLNTPVVNLTNTSSVTHQGLSGFKTCAMKQAASVPTKSQTTFCTVINTSGTNYNGESAQYEIMVPTNATANSNETYYFYAEIQ